MYLWVYLLKKYIFILGTKYPLHLIRFVSLANSGRPTKLPLPLGCFGKGFLARIRKRQDLSD